MAGASIEPARSRAEGIAFGASVIFLVAAPLAASGGIRATCLIVAMLAIAFGGWRDAIAHLPRATVAMVAAWFAMAPLSLAWTIDPTHTLEELRAETFYSVLAFIVFFVLATQSQRWRAWWLAIVGGTLLALAAKGMQQGFGVMLWRHAPDGGAGAFSTHLVLVAPLLVALAWNPPWGLRRNAWLLAASLAVLLAAAWSARESWTTPNRIVWPALGAAFIVAVAAARRTPDHAASPIPGLRRVVMLCGLAIAIAFVASIAAKSERFYPADPDIAASVEHDLRPKLWAVGWEQWKSAPWLGHGFGREILAKAFLPETPQGVNHPLIRHGHNALLNIALQLGIVGLALFVGVLILLAREYAGLLANPAVDALGVIGLALLAGFLTKNMTDDFLHRHNAQVFWALNGMLLGFAARARRA